MSEEAHFEIYSIGIMALSLCTDIEDRKEIERRANQEQPTRISSKWEISKDTHFRSGEANPHNCERGMESLHYLLHC